MQTDAGSAGNASSGSTADMSTQAVGNAASGFSLGMLSLMVSGQGNHGGGELGKIIRHQMSGETADTGGDKNRESYLPSKPKDGERHRFEYNESEFKDWVEYTYDKENDIWYIVWSWEANGKRYVQSTVYRLSGEGEELSVISKSELDEIIDKKLAPPPQQEVYSKPVKRIVEFSTNKKRSSRRTNRTKGNGLKDKPEDPYYVATGTAITKMLESAIDVTPPKYKSSSVPNKGVWKDVTKGFSKAKGYLKAFGNLLGIGSGILNVSEGLNKFAKGDIAGGLISFGKAGVDFLLVGMKTTPIGVALSVGWSVISSFF